MVHRGRTRTGQSAQADFVTFQRRFQPLGARPDIAPSGR
jgi:hypothetical protein